MNNIDDSIISKESSDEISLDEAIKQTGNGKFHYALLFIVAVCTFAFVIELSCASYLVPAVHCDIDMTSEEKSVLSSISYVGLIASSHLWGYLADTKGRRSVLVVSLGLDFLCSVGASFSPSYAVLITFRFFNGFLICCAANIIYTYLGEFHSDETRSRAIVLSGTFLMLANILLPGLAWLIIPQKWNLYLPSYTFHSWRVFIIICAVPSLLGSIILQLFFPETPKFLLVQGRKAEALQVLRRMYSANTGNNAESYQVNSVAPELDEILHIDENLHGMKRVMAELKEMWNQTTPLFKKPHHFRSLLSSLLFFGILGSMNTLLLWMPDVSNQLSEYSKTHDGPATICKVMSMKMDNDTSFSVMGSSALSEYTVIVNEQDLTNDDCGPDVNLATFQNTLFGSITGAVMTLLVFAFINKIGRKIAMGSLMFLCACSGVGLHFADTSVSIVILLCIFVGLGATCFGILNSCVADLFPTYIRGMAYCLTSITGLLGVVVGSALVGALVDTDCDAIMFILSGLALLSALVCLFIPTERNMKPLQEAIREQPNVNNIVSMT